MSKNISSFANVLWNMRFVRYANNLWFMLTSTGGTTCRRFWKCNCTAQTYFVIRQKLIRWRHHGIIQKWSEICKETMKIVNSAFFLCKIDFWIPTNELFFYFWKPFRWGWLSCYEDLNYNGVTILSIWKRKLLPKIHPLRQLIH